MKATSVKLTSVTVSDICQGGLLPPIVCMDEAPLVEVIKLLATQRIHRVYVNTSFGEQQNYFPSGILSLTDIMRLLWFKDSAM